MGFKLYQLLLPLLFLLFVFGLAWYQKRKKTVISKIRLVVSNGHGPTVTSDKGKTFERHLEAVKSPPRIRDTKQ